MEPDFVRDVTDWFGELHQVDSRNARICLVSAFITCYGMMGPEERFNTLEVIVDIARTIKSERFEDGVDFVDFLKQNQIEGKKNESD